MKASRIWVAEFRRISLLLIGVILVSWALGFPLLGVVLTVLMVLTHWFVQLWRIQEWLSNPEKAPPEGRGIWGDIFDQIYHLRRREKETREQLLSTVKYLQDSFASMRDGAVMVDESGVIQWANEAARRLLGLQYPQDQGQGILNLVRVPEFQAFFNGGDYSDSLTINTGVEADLFLQVDITPFGEGNRLIFVRDMTQVIRMEQVRRDFVGNVSHELRTPLTVITGYLDTILDNAENLETRFIKPLEQMSEQAARMENLLKDLLWLSRIENVRKVDSRERVNIPALLEELCDELRNNYPERQLELKLDTSAAVLGDYRELYSAVSNLVLNAIKYSSPDSKVTLSWFQSGEDHHLSVADTGQGIAAVHLPRLTERFYRVDESRSSSTGGTGLGLAIVKHVAVAHQAELRIDSVYGVGSKFSLVFPATAVASADSANL